MDLSVFNGPRPAYASDLMAANTGNVLSVVTFQGLRVFTIAGFGVIGEDTLKAASGTLETGRTTYGLHDVKVSMFVSVSHLPLAGTLAVAMSRDGATYVDLPGEGVTAGSVSSSFPTGKARAEGFDLKLTLTRAAAATTTGPTVTRLTLRAYPVTSRSERVTLPLLLNRDQYTRNGAARGRSVSDDLQFLRALEADGTSVLYQEGDTSVEVVIEDHVWVPHQMEPDGNAFNGTYYAKLRRFASE
jgi:hypothetical protein